MKVAETKTSAAQIQAKDSSHEQPFFARQNGAEPAFFSKNDGVAKPFFSPGTVQPKLKIGSPDDVYERQADAVADQVVAKLNTPAAAPAVQAKPNTETPEEQLPEKEELPEKTGEELQRKPIFDSAATPPPDDDTAQRKCAECEKEDTEKVQRKPEGEGGESTASPDVSSRLQSSKGGGSPLPEDTRSSMESAMGADFSGVRVHTGSEAAGLSQDLGAQAFTHGSDIYFNEGKYNTGSTDGQKLLAHELTHTVQQGGAVKRKPLPEPEKGISPEIQENQGTNKVEDNHPQQQNAQPSLGNASAQVEEPRITPADNPVPEIQLKSQGNAPDIQKFDIPGSSLVSSAWNGITSVGQSIASGVSSAVSSVREGIGEAVDFLRNIINSGIAWVSNAWNQLKEFVSSGLNGVLNFFQSITSLISAPFRSIYNAITNFDASSLSAGWNAFKQFVSSLWHRFRGIVQSLVQRFFGFWDRIGGFVGSLFGRIRAITESRLFRVLPELLQNIGRRLINSVERIWQNIQNWWLALRDRATAFVNQVLDQVEKFVNNIVSFGITGLVTVIQTWAAVIKFLIRAARDPEGVIIQPLANRIAPMFSGVEPRFAGEIQRRVGGNASNSAQTASGTIQRTPTTSTGARTITRPEVIGRGLLHVMGEKWHAFSFLDMVIGFVRDLVFPVYGNIMDSIKLYHDIRDIVTKPFHADSLQEFWTSLLKILDIVNLILTYIVTVVMRTLGPLLIIAAFIPPLAPFAHAIGLILLALFVVLEVENINLNLRILSTGLTDEDEKTQRYNRIGDSIVALIITALFLLIFAAIAWLASKLGSVIKGFIQGKKVPPTPEAGSGASGGGGEARVPAEGETGTPRQGESQGDNVGNSEPTTESTSSEQSRNINEEVQGGRTKPGGIDWKQSPNWQKFVERGGSILEHPDGSFTLIDAEGTRVRYGPEGEPDFSPHLNDPWGIRQVDLEGGFANPRNRPADFRAANESVGHPEWGGESPPEYTWHHTRNDGTMQLVPRRIHSRFPHSGGISRIPN